VASRHSVYFEKKKIGLQCNLLLVWNNEVPSIHYIFIRWALKIKNLFNRNIFSIIFLLFIHYILFILKSELSDECIMFTMSRVCGFLFCLLSTFGLVKFLWFLTSASFLIENWNYNRKRRGVGNGNFYSKPIFKKKSIWAIYSFEKTCL